MTLLGFPCSTAKTLAIGPVLVTPGPGGPGRNTLLRKQAPPMITSCAALQSPSLGVTPSTTGARTLVLSVADVDRAFRTLVKGGMKNRLLSPSPNLVVSVAVPTPPHAARGKGVPGKPGKGANVPRTRLRLIGVTLMS